MSPSAETAENTGTENTATATEVPINEQVKAAVVLADDLSNTFKDKKTTATVLMMATPEEKAVLNGINEKIKAISGSQKQIYALSVEASRVRNAGKPLPPSKQKAKDEADARRKAKEEAAAKEAAKNK